MVTFTGCTQSTKQGVFGVVRGTPYRGMPTILQPDQQPQKNPKAGPILNNITVQVREYFKKNKKMGKIIASTKTNEKGFYQFNLPTGTYFLVIVNADIKYAIRHTDKNSPKKDMINVSKLINITSGTLIEQNITIPQLWPQ